MMALTEFGPTLTKHKSSAPHRGATSVGKRHPQMFFLVAASRIIREVIINTL